MAREKKSFAGLIRAAIFIILEIAALAMLSSSSSLQNIWLNRASRRIQASLWGGGETLRSYFILDKQNKELARANAALTEELNRYRSISDALLDGQTKESGRFRYTPATVVKMSRNSSHNYIILDKGSEDGIKPNSGIITDNGVVGFIEAVGKRYSYGITLMNSNASVSARVGDTGFTGPLVWDGRSTNRAFLKDLPMHYENQPGDTVFTSGFSSIFPPDIPIGITGEAAAADGATLRIGVVLLQDFGTVRYVTVVENMDKQEISALEAEEEDL